MAYRYKNYPFSSSVAEHLTPKLLQEAERPQGRKEIVELCARTHRNRGGLSGTAPLGAVKKALTKLVSAGKVKRLHGYYEWIQTREPIVDDPPPTEAVEPLWEPEDYDMGDGNSYVYAYYYSAYRLLAEKSGETIFPIKVGRSKDYQERIGSQSRATGMPEDPEVSIVWRTDRPEAAERMLHGHLDFRGKRLPDAPGSEWFLTSPDEIKQIIRSIMPDVSIRSGVADEEAST